MKRMKATATILLLTALAGAVISWPFRANFWGGLALSAFEAAMVGALADWFAIVAIFRHPLGIKIIPHTAIIPNNRERIINTISDIVENQWLNLEIIKTKINEYPVIDKISSALESKEGGAKLEGFISSILSNTLKNIEPEYLAQFVHRVISENFSEITISDEAVERLETTVKELYGNDLMDFLIDKISDIVSDDDFIRVLRRTLHRAADDYSLKGGLFRRLGKGVGEGLNIINYEEAAESISVKIAEFLQTIKVRRNPYRLRIMSAFSKIRFPGENGAESLVNGLIKKIITTDDGFKTIVDIMKIVKEQLICEEIEKAPLIKYFADIVIEQIAELKKDEKRKTEFEGWLKGEAIGLVEKYHTLIGSIVKENLQSLNDQTFVDSLEEKVGEDLQWIRVNGTIIGAIVGIIEYLILHII